MQKKRNFRVIVFLAVNTSHLCVSEQGPGPLLLLEIGDGKLCMINQLQGLREGE